MKDDELLLTPKERKEHEYYRVSGGWVYNLDTLLEAQLAKAKPIIEKQERERILREVFPQDIYPAHLKQWAKTIRVEQGYESTMTAFLDYLGAKWQALKEGK